MTKPPLYESDFSFQGRSQTLAEVEKQNYDLLIIGGGIIGAGVARDAASRGMKVLLVEQNDFSEGTSSRSSKLIHGGLRYLENYEFHLVFEALSERRVLFEIAPHLVHPLTFVLPLFQGGRFGMRKMGLGMWAYDALALFHTPKYHERMNPEQTLEELPLLRSKNLLGSYSYSDAYMDDDRLVLETLRSAASMGAQAVNFVKAGQARMDSQGRMEAVEIEDKLTQKKYWVRAQHFISAVGAWTDQFAKGLIPWRPIMRPTKGIHLTFSRDRFPLKDAVVMAAEKRIIFGIPRHEMVIVGTTDTDFKQSPEEVHTTLEDVDYLLEIVGKYFPKAQLGKEDILASYAGVRPLVDDGSNSESKTSREHVILSTPHNLTFVAGGKYTTYRLIAEQVMKKALVNFPLERRIRFGINSTKQPVNPMITRESMHEVQKEIEDWVLEYRISPQEAEVLIQRHGPEARFLLQDGHTQTLRNVWEMEAYFAIRNTMCLRLKDFMLRRSPLFLAQKEHGQSLLGGIAQVFQKELGWSDAKTEEEKKLYLKHLDFELSWKS